MDTFVKGLLGNKMQEASQELMEEIEPLGYKVGPDGISFLKLGRIESVVNELMPICDSLGLDVDDLELVEYRQGDESIRSFFEQGEITRDYLG